jgi:hypothetical protein
MLHSSTFFYAEKEEKKVKKRKKYIVHTTFNFLFEITHSQPQAKEIP